MGKSLLTRHSERMNETTQELPPPPPEEPRRLTLVREGRWLAGVCTGLARYFKLDPVIFRIGFVVAVFVGGAFDLVAWLVC